MRRDQRAPRANALRYQLCVICCMVTASGVRAVGVTVAALFGLALGFYVQDALKQQTLARIEARVAAALRDGAEQRAAPAPPAAPRALR